jgi:hypothetical protein
MRCHLTAWKHLDRLWSNFVLMHNISYMSATRTTAWLLVNINFKKYILLNKKYVNWLTLLWISTPRKITRWYCPHPLGDWSDWEEMGSIGLWPIKTTEREQGIELLLSQKYTSWVKDLSPLPFAWFWLITVLTTFLHNRLISFSQSHSRQAHWGYSRP